MKEIKDYLPSILNKHNWKINSKAKDYNIKKTKKITCKVHSTNHYISIIKNINSSQSNKQK